MQDRKSTKTPRIKKERDLHNETEVSSTTENASGQLSTFILIISLFVIYDVIVVSDPSVDFQALKTELMSSVHNQSEPVDVVIESLYKIQNHDQIVNIVNFIGSTGVGKTFMVNILKRHFYPSAHEVKGPLLYGAQQEILNQIKHSTFKYNLIVIEDLTISNIDSLLLFIKKIPQDVIVLVVCVFSNQESDNFLNYKINYDHADIIVNKFNLAQIPHKIAKFHEFSREQASDWVVKQLVMKGVNLQFHSKVIESVLLGQNLKYHGLKGLSTKINLEL